VYVGLNLKADVELRQAEQAQNTKQQAAEQAGAPISTKRANDEPSKK